MAKRRALGRGLTGFAQSFLPAWQSMRYMDLAKKREERAEMRDIRNEIDRIAAMGREGYQPSEWYEQMAATMATDEMPKDAIMERLRPGIRTDPERLSEALRMAGENAPFIEGPEIDRLFRQVHLGPSQAKTLPSESLFGVAGLPSAAGFPVERMVLDSTEEPVRSIPLDEDGLSDLRATSGVEELLEGLRLREGPQLLGDPGPGPLEASILEGIEGTPAPGGTWRPTPIGEQFDALQESGRAAREARRDLALEGSAMVQRQEARIAEEIAKENFTTEEGRRAIQMAATSRDAFLLYDKQVRLRMELERAAALDPETRKARTDEAAEMAKIRAILNDSPQIFRTMDGDEVYTFAIVRNPTTGNREWVDVSDVEGLGGIPYSESGRQFSAMQDIMARYNINEEGGQREAMRDLIGQGYGPDEARRAIEGLASTTGDPPRPPNADQDVDDIYGLGSDPSEGLEGAADLPALLSPQIILQTLNRMPDTGWRKSKGGGINPFDFSLIDLSKLTDPGGSPRARNDFLDRPGVIDWIARHAESDDISHKMLQAFINSPDGLRMLMEAYDQ